MSTVETENLGLSLRQRALDALSAKDSDVDTLSVFRIISGMSQGAWSTAYICIFLIRRVKAVLPSSRFLEPVHWLFENSFTGERIVHLWKISGEHFGKMLAVIFACKHSVAGVTRELLERAMSGAESLDLDRIVEEVKRRFPDFNLNATLMI